MEFFASKEFELLNPSKKIPVLKDGDFLLSESTAICHYLILKNNIDKRLLGESITEKALVTHRICYNVGTLFQKLYDICVSHVYAEILLVNLFNSFSFFSHELSYNFI